MAQTMATFLFPFDTVPQLSFAVKPLTRAGGLPYSLRGNDETRW